MGIDFFVENCFQISAVITRNYSTSFSLATSMLDEEQRRAIYAIYGFVRLADEIVDSFHNYDKGFLLNDLKQQLRYALDTGISSNPVLVSFVKTVKKYNIPQAHIDAFLHSMELDITKSDYATEEEMNRYIYGSADVVGLMCLKIFCNGDQTTYNQLEHSAQKLGSAFQKVNFLRDLNVDKDQLCRTYFPELFQGQFDSTTKQAIERSIENDFNQAIQGIRLLSGRPRLAVALAYYYYRTLFNKIREMPPERILSERVRICNLRKYFIILKVVFLHSLNRL